MTTLKELKRSYQMIHFFGLGFVQLKINPNLRYHFYHPSLTSIMNEEEVHNHRYVFTSTILAGALKEEVYDFEKSDDGKYWMVYESCEKGVTPPPLKESGNLILKENNQHQKGEIYTRYKEQFHRVATDFCITKLTRGNEKEDFAKVIRLKGLEKVCPFSKNLSEKECWEIVEQCLGLAKYH